jgi:GTP cyclohydrolase IA
VIRSRLLLVGWSDGLQHNGDARLMDSTDPTRSPMPATASSRIRDRLRKAGRRFFANDNISDCIAPGELDELVEEVADRMQSVLEGLVIDIENDHNTRDTARRVAKMYVSEVFGGRFRPAPTVTEFPNVTSLNELMIVGPLTVRSACSHHLCPIMGRMWVGVMPNQHSNLIGLSKYVRLVDWIMNRPQIQEEAISQMAELLMSMVKPDGLALVMEAEHFCMRWRGVKENSARMTNSVMRGSFLKNEALRREFLSFVAGRE